MIRFRYRFTGRWLWCLEGLVHVAGLLLFVEDTETIVLCILGELALVIALHTGKKRPPANDIPAVAPLVHCAPE